jgi:hypothetical protein
MSQALELVSKLGKLIGMSQVVLAGIVQKSYHLLLILGRLVMMMMPMLVVLMLVIMGVLMTLTGIVAVLMRMCVAVSMLM